MKRAIAIVGVALVVASTAATPASAKEVKQPRAVHGRYCKTAYAGDWTKTASGKLYC